MDVFVICKSGVEWNEIVSVHAIESEAEAAMDRHETRRLASKDVMDRMSHYNIERHELKGANRT